MMEPQGRLRKGLEEEMRLHSVILSSLFYAIWSLRNNTLFEGKLDLADAVKKMEGMVDRFALRWKT